MSPFESTHAIAITSTGEQAMQPLLLAIVRLVILLLLSPPCLAFDIGSVWNEGQTNTTLTVNAKISETNKFKAQTPATYEVCWKIVGTWQGACGANSITTNALPYTITGLIPGVEYKVRINVLCYKKNIFGNWKNLEMRNLNECKMKTLSAYGGTISVVPTDTSLTVTINWAGGTGSSAPGWIRIGYKKASNFFYDLHGVLSNGTQTIPGNWSPGNWVKGAIEISQANITPTMTHTFTGLKQCRNYIVEATYLTGSGSLDGTEIDRTKVRTTGNCGFGSFKTEPTLNDLDGLGADYVDAATAHYAAALTPSVHMVGVAASGPYLVGLSHAPGASVLALHTLDGASPTALHSLGALSTAAHPSATTIPTAAIGPAAHMAVMHTSWEIYGTASPSQPARLGGTTGPAPGLAVAATATAAYVAMGAAGLAVVNVSNPATPVVSNVVSGLGTILDAKVAGTTLYAASSDIGVLAFDISAPLSPVLVNLYTPGYTQCATVIAAGPTHLYVANDAGLEVLDVSSLSRVGVLAGVSQASQAEHSGTSVYLTGAFQSGPTSASGILRIDVGAPTAPFFVGSYAPHTTTLPAVVRRFSLYQSRLFVALDTGGCAVVDASAMSSVSDDELGRWAPGSSPVLAHLAATNPAMATAISAAESTGDVSINDHELLAWLVREQRAGFDVWQGDPALQAAGLELAAWTQANYPQEWSSYLSLLGPVGFEGYNIDLGDPSSAPPGSYPGAALHEGTWDTVAAPWTGTLVDVNGRPSTVTAAGTAGTAFAFNHPATEDDDQALYDDGQRLGLPGSSATWTFTNLNAGNYVVTTYAWNPQDATAVVDIDVLGSLSGVKTCGGAWSDAEIEGLTFVQHSVAVADGTLIVNAVVSVGVGILNGFQIRRQYPVFDGLDYCFGDGSGSACPCGNAGIQGNGCASSLNPYGANLLGSGLASIASDSVVLTGSGMPNSSALYFQGNTQQSGGAGGAFGDGLRCVAGAVIRLGTKTNVAGVSEYPTGSDAPISVRGAIAAPGVRTYQVWYRNAAAYCTPSTFNLTNAVQVMWTP